MSKTKPAKPVIPAEPAGKVRQVQVPLSEKEAKTCRQAAKAAGLTWPNWCRQALLGRAYDQRIDQGEWETAYP